jgi:hypothetical protein
MRPQIVVARRRKACATRVHRVAFPSPPSVSAAMSLLTRALRARALPTLARAPRRHQATQAQPADGPAVTATNRAPVLSSPVGPLLTAAQARRRLSSGSGRPSGSRATGMAARGR